MTPACRVIPSQKVALEASLASVSWQGTREKDTEGEHHKEGHRHYYSQDIGRRKEESTSDIQMQVSSWPAWA